MAIILKDRLKPYSCRCSDKGRRRCRCNLEAGCTKRDLELDVFSQSKSSMRELLEGNTAVLRHERRAADGAPVVKSVAFGV